MLISRSDAKQEQTEQVLLVTGGSRGIGAATAMAGACAGYTVCVNYIRNEGAADRVVEAIGSAGGQAIAIQADVSVEAEVVRMFETVDRTFGPVTALVNNAGIVRQQCRIEDMTAARIDEMLKVNVTSAFICAREAVQRMSTKNGGSGGAIVNVSSAASRLGSAGEYVDYAAAKAAIDTMTIGLSQEVATEGIRVNAVRPGFIYTDIHAAGGEPNRVDRVKQSVPMKRGGCAEEVAEAILWLLSDKASFTTGGFIDVAGGR